ncbi:MAG TPA: DUF1398 family protein [Tepidisphaeraceae bacterium]|nr:DUF1398 family protein [Tepidisphaeraceae bacterium]
MARYLNVSVILECTRLAMLNQMTFPQSLAELAKIGVERYTADLVRLEKTHYSACGDSLTDPLPLSDAPEIAEQFSANAVVAALRAIQQKKIDYAQFLRQIMSAGCATYWVFLKGRKAIYLGRSGESHIENFPPKPAL